jgi:hypothetical protein
LEEEMRRRMGVELCWPRTPPHLLLLGLGRVVVAIPDYQGGGGLEEEFGQDTELVDDVGRSYRQTDG